ncbi:GAF and ANTAR domain-containing protein [Mycolicibacterium sp. 050158]|uniref:GAF and ANTAR domain-containing protein n=1 Tax=Mycolicibacterium sp. 050158 TaxID=3090602 RepID=UPI00299EDD79|nr:GAF and ANTAR domain-containing protein [Mycolicibacterium sp. 050158]MDX1888813.1 GAF and ANTAR domain-containing protein [Mycolicibacterium sp. 050158]
MHTSTTALGRDEGESLQSTIADLAGALARGTSTDEVLVRLTAASLTLVPSADFAKISTVSDRGLVSLAATSRVTMMLDCAQQASRQGPCLDAMRARRTIRCDDLESDVRWPRFAARAATAGVHSVLSSPISVPGDMRVALSLFGSRTGAFGVESETVGAVLANHAAIALAHRERERQFKAALATRDVIGQAKGMVMERFGVDATQAFGMLVAISRDTNTPVRDLAARAVDARSRGGRRAR